MLTRRQFIGRGIALGAGAALPANRLWAAMPEPAPGRFLVFLSVFGGMDVTLGLDPWTAPTRPNPASFFLEYRADELVRAGDFFFGPAAGVLARYRDQIAVINGVLVSKADNGHPAAVKYMNTGNGEGHSPDVPVGVALAGGAGPYGVLTDSALFLADRKVAQSRTKDIYLASLGPNPAAALRSVPAGRGESALQKSLEEVILSADYTAALNAAVAQLPVEHDQVEDYRILAAAFRVEAARQGMLQIYEGDLDTHTDHPGRHLRLQKASWAKVATIFDYFKSVPYRGGSLFDATTFAVVSEFSRTPFLNPGKGKDHNPLTNSVLLAGAGVKGGMLVGGSRFIDRGGSPAGEPYHMAAPLRFETGSVASEASGAHFIYPENVAATIAAAVGVKGNAFANVPAGTRLIPKVLV